MPISLLTGRCLCQAITYTVSSQPDISMICYCADCQKVSGGGHLPQLGANRDALNITGSVKTYTTVSDAGYDVDVGFCETCGTTIYKTTSRFPDKVFLTAGSLDDPSGFEPSARVYEESKQPWDTG